MTRHLLAIALALATPLLAADSEPDGIDWASLLKESGLFLGVEQGFRYATEPGTRHPHVSFLDGYQGSLSNLHGWADGDPFLVNYVGHPMQGSVTGFLFVHNDRKFRAAEFGKNRQYWKSRLRATAYAFAYSEQFEIGPLSEASIGHTQSFFPQTGFADQVVTPSIGLGWMIAEDSLDRYVIAPLESRTRNRVLRTLLRGGLNPSRSMSNMMAFRVPWARDTRAGIWNSVPPLRTPPITSNPQAIAPFEFLTTAQYEQFYGDHARGACIGGGGTAAFRVADHWQLVADVRGCKLTRFGDHLSGDSLTYLVGPRWTPTPLGHWQPYAQLLLGGRTLTHELIDPVKKAQLELQAAQNGQTLSFADHSLYTTASEATGLAISAHAGADIKLTSAVAFRVADASYTHTWHSTLSGISYAHSLQFTSGLILRLGTW